MSDVKKLLLAVGLALAAAVMNAAWLSAEKHPPSYVAASTDIEDNAEITDSMLQAIPVPGDADTLRASLIPWDSRATLLGLKASRAYHQGDVFFQNDIKAPRQLAEFEVLGPFKLIGVGSRFTQGNTKQEDSQTEISGDNITIAVSSKFDDRTRRLLQIIDPTKGENHERQTRIVAIQVIPKTDQQASAAVDEKDVVYQTVSLEGITNVPRVLLAGDVIRFVIPAHSL
jgi:hypothetical protein